MKDIIKIVPDISEQESSEHIKIGQWYWVKSDDDNGDDEEGGEDDDNGDYWRGDKENRDADGRWFGCVVDIGSNYIKLRGIERHRSHNSSYTQVRIHMDDFFEQCELEPKPEQIIDAQVHHYKDKVNRLMGRVQEITTRLAVSPKTELSDGGSETQALAVINEEQNFDEYKTALVKAKEDLLPELFEKIKDANSNLASWMSARVIPLEAQAGGLDDTIESIDDRIFSIELYAGLVEQVERIADGEPADNDAKLHLMQRRCYMDEECLANYTTGGMDFKGIRAFDRWLVRSDNLDRILPFPRCMVAFRVRRNRKDYGPAVTIYDFIRFRDMHEENEKTFLYIRNGEQVFRMSTEIGFDEKLFPDLDRSILTSGQKIWAEMFAGNIQKLVTENEYKEILAEEEREYHEYKEELKAWKAAKKQAKKQGKKFAEFRPHKPWSRIGESYKPFDESSVYYDDIAKKIAKDIKHHNRIALIIQGLLDRSPVLHPHPPYQIWTEGGFKQCIELVFDDSRALNPANMPDFEEYRSGLNESLRVGSVTVGQELVWEKHETKKEHDRMDRNWRRSDYRPTTFRPDGNPGPGYIARVAIFTKKSRKCTYKWERERLRDRWDNPFEIPTKFTVEAKDLLNVDAYTPGDYHQFFDDPRMRERYLEWAPLLMAAEDYHAGEIQLGAPS